jgi:hypothetical protein
MRTLMLLLLLARTAAAEPTEEKSVVVAYGLTIAATSVPVATAGIVGGDDPQGTRGNVAGIVATAALLLGPSAGHWYAGETWTTGLTLRLGGAAVLGAMVLREQQEPLGTGTLIVGGMSAAGLIAAGMLWDFVTVPSAVRRANRERQLVLAPTTNGFAVAGRF